MFQTTLLKEILQKQYLITYRNLRKHQIFSVIYRQIKLTFLKESVQSSNMKTSF